MRNLNWLDPGAPMREDLVANAERRLGVRFPRDYVSMVLMHDGASNPEEGVFDYLDSGRKRTGSFGALLSLRENVSESIFEEMRLLRDQLPERVIPIVETGGGDCVCLDYRAGAKRVIVFFAHEKPLAQSILPLAESFDSFLKKLRIPVEY